MKMNRNLHTSILDLNINRYAMKRCGSKCLPEYQVSGVADLMR